MRKVSKVVFHHIDVREVVASTQAVAFFASIHLVAYLLGPLLK
jgi:hypothetical protein